MTAYESEEPLFAAEPIDPPPTATVTPGPQPTVVVPATTEIPVQVSPEARRFLWFAALFMGFIPIYLATGSGSQVWTYFALIALVIFRSVFVASTDGLLRSKLDDTWFFKLAVYYVAIDITAGLLAVEPGPRLDVIVLGAASESGIITFILLLAARVEHYSLVVVDVDRPHSV